MIKDKVDTNKIIDLLFCVFIIIFVLSYTKIANSTIIRYSVIIFMNLIGLYYCLFNKNSYKIDRKLGFLFILLTFFMMLSVMFSNYFGESLIKTLSVIDAFLLFFIFVPNIIKNKSLKRIVEIIYFALFVVLLYEFIRYRGVYTYDGGTRLSTIHNRLILNFIYPSSLGWPGFLLCISSVYLFDEKTKHFFKKTLYIISFLFGLYLLYKCDIRTAIYSLIIFIVLFVLNYKIKQSKVFKSNKKFLNFIIYIAVFAIVAMIGLYLFSGKLSIDKINLIMSNRLTYYNSAISDILNGNVIFGIGAYRNLNGSVYGISQIDNSYLNFIYSYGVLNLIILIYILFYIYKKIKNKNINTSKTDETQELKNKWFIISLYVSFLVYSFFEITLLNISSLLAIIVWPIIISYILSKEGNKDEK